MLVVFSALSVVGVGVVIQLFVGFVVIISIVISVVFSVVAAVPPRARVPIIIILFITIPPGSVSLVSPFGGFCLLPAICCNNGNYVLEYITLHSAGHFPIML